MRLRAVSERSNESIGCSEVERLGVSGRRAGAGAALKGLLGRWRMEGRGAVWAACGGCKVEGVMRWGCCWVVDVRVWSWWGKGAVPGVTDAD
jgi:hypothetical protein